MAHDSNSPLDILWKGYGRAFQDFDDLTMARWLAQTLGQLENKAWRLSHPLVGAYRLAAQIGHDRQIWHKRLATPPAAYRESPCCRAPLLPLMTREIRECGMLCLHCNETLVPFDELPEESKMELDFWAGVYEPVHEVAHWDDRQRKSVSDYNHAYEKAAKTAEDILFQMGKVLAPRMLDHYPAVIWEDQDECLEVRPEDVMV